MQQMLGKYQRKTWFNSDELANEMERLARDGWFVHTMTAVELGLAASGGVVDMLFVIYRKED